MAAQSSPNQPTTATHTHKTIPTDLITTRHASRLLGNCHLSCIIRWIYDGRILGWKVGGRWKCSRASVEAFLVPAAQAKPEAMVVEPIVMRQAPGAVTFASQT